MPRPARIAAIWARSLSERKCEEVAIPARRFGLDAGDIRRERIEADDGVAGEIIDAFRQAMFVDVAAVGIEPAAHLADTPRDQRRLLGAHHAHRDIGGTAEEIVDAVRQHELDDEARIVLAEIGKDRRQHLGADDLARRDAYDAGGIVGEAGGGPHHRRGGAGHGLCVGTKLDRGLGRDEAVRRAGEEDDAQRLLEGIDVAADGRLGEAEFARRSRQAAARHDGEEGARELPAGGRVGHTQMYSRPTKIGNFLLAPADRCRARERKRRPPMSKPGTALVIGATGGAGSEAARALVARGWRVKALNRTLPKERGEIQWIAGDALDTKAVADAAKGADVIVHAANPAYYRNWRDLAMPMLANAIAAAVTERALIVFPGNVYNYGPDAWPVIHEDSPQHPISKKGAVRVEMEEMLERAAADGARVLILRAPDLFGAPSPSSNFGSMIVHAGKPVTRITLPGAPEIGRAWAYTPDLAEAMVALIDKRDDLAPFETVNFAGQWLTGAEMADAIRTAVGNPSIPVRGFPWWLVHGLAPVVRLFRELAEMHYLWRTPLRLDNTRLVSLIGAEPRTPIDKALPAALTAIGCLPQAA